MTAWANGCIGWRLAHPRTPVVEVLEKAWAGLAGWHGMGCGQEMCRLPRSWPLWLQSCLLPRVARAEVCRAGCMQGSKGCCVKAAALKGC
eukprot:92324-Chlamydomonas_euryale.AAC.3